MVNWVKGRLSLVRTCRNSSKDRGHRGRPGNDFSNRTHFYLTGKSATSGIAYENMFTLVIKYVRSRIVADSLLILTTIMNQALNHLAGI